MVGRLSMTASYFGSVRLGSGAAVVPEVLSQRVQRGIVGQIVQRHVGIQVTSPMPVEALGKKTQFWFSGDQY
jgi:hypothetical protein